MDSVEPQRGEAPEGTRGAGAAIAGALVVSLQPTVQLITAMVTLMREWARRGHRTVRVEIDGDVHRTDGRAGAVGDGAAVCRRGGRSPRWSSVECCCSW